MAALVCGIALIAGLGYVLSTYEDSLQVNRIVAVIWRPEGVDSPEGESAALQRTLSSLSRSLYLARVHVCDAGGREFCLYNALKGALEDYVLFVEPGQEIRIVQRTRRLTLDVYTVRQSNTIDATDGIAIVAARVLRDGRCVFEMPVAPFLDCTYASEAGKGTATVPTTAHYADLELHDPEPARGSLAGEKLIETWLRENPHKGLHKGRALFYLAQSRELRADYAGAKQAYEDALCQKLSSNYHFYALYALAKLELRAANDTSPASRHRVRAAFERAMLEGIEGLMRWEPRYYLARMFRAAKEYNLCLVCAQEAVRTRTVQIDEQLRQYQPLRLETAIYGWALKQEYDECMKHIL